MSIERKHDIADLYAQYEGRRPVLVEENAYGEKINLQLDKSALVRLATNGMPEAAHDYDLILKGDPGNSIRKSRIIDGEGREIKTASLHEGSPVHFVVRKTFGKVHDDFVDRRGTYPPCQAGEEKESVFFEFFHGEEEIGGYRLDRDMLHGNAWALNHRMVSNQYREQGFDSVLFSATESFFQNYAHEHGTPQKITANTGQPSVLVRLLNRGFIPSTDEDRRKMEMVLGADPTLELDYAVCNAEIWKDGKATGEYAWTPETFKDPYVFKKGTDLKTELNALRINLEKIYEPRVSRADEARLETHGAILENGQ